MNSEVRSAQHVTPVPASAGAAPGASGLMFTGATDMVATLLEMPRELSDRYAWITQPQDLIDRHDALLRTLEEIA